MKGDWSERVGRVIEGVSWGSDRVRGRMITCEQAWVDELREMNSEDESIESNGIDGPGWDRQACELTDDEADS